MATHKPKVIIRKNAANEWQYGVYGGNGEFMAGGEGYASKSSNAALDGLVRLRDALNSLDSVFVESYDGSISEVFLPKSIIEKGDESDSTSVQPEK